MCYNPTSVYDKNTGNRLVVSCRKCSECLQTRANEWAVRGHFELKKNKDNCFITLTYENNPVRLHKEHMQMFIKRLRKSISPAKIKYFSCGEYGDQYLRPHYHLIIFGYDFQDKLFWKMSNSGKPIYISYELEHLWPYGMCTTQEANAQTISYSAKYSAHLKTNLPEHLQKYPEYNTMSHNLGIDEIMKNIETYLLTDKIYVNGFGHQIPDIILQRYAKNILEYDDENTQLWVQAYKNQREKRIEPETVFQQNKIKERLANKKILFTKLKEL